METVDKKNQGKLDTLLKSTRQGGDRGTTIREKDKLQQPARADSSGDGGEETGAVISQTLERKGPEEGSQPLAPGGVVRGGVAKAGGTGGVVGVKSSDVESSKVQTENDECVEKYGTF